MGRKKLFIIMAILLAVAMVFFFLNLFSGNDNSRPQLDNVYNNNLQLVDLSVVAADSGSVYALKVVASGLSVTVASDNQRLSSYYQERYAKVPKENKLTEADDPAEKLRKTEAGGAFDNFYTEQAASLLESNLGILQQLKSESKRSDLLELIDSLTTTQNNALEQINSLP